MPDTTIHDQLRSLLLECLRKEMPGKPTGHPFRPEYLFGMIAKIAETRDLKYNNDIPAWHENTKTRQPQLHGNLEQPITDIVWDLIIEGVLRPDSHSEARFFSVHLTDYGRKTLEDSETEESSKRRFNRNDIHSRERRNFETKLFAFVHSYTWLRFGEDVPDPNGCIRRHSQLNRSDRIQEEAGQMFRGQAATRTLHEMV